MHFALFINLTSESLSLLVISFHLLLRYTYFTSLKFLALSHCPVGRFVLVAPFLSSRIIANFCLYIIL
jgi:hypothetical protein